jgi:hypothetical protein
MEGTVHRNGEPWDPFCGVHGTDAQPEPIPNDGPSMHDLVIEDMKTRKEFGLNKYGTTLQANNGRDALRDAYEEALDLTVYLRQLLEERTS